MLATLCLRFFVLCQIIPLPGFSHPAPPPNNPPAATQPSENASAQNPGALEAFGNTTLGKLFTGKKTLTPGEAVTLQFWLNAAKDLVMAAIAFVPRLFVAMLFLLIFFLFYKGVRRIVLGSMAKAHVDSSIRDLLGSLLRWGIMGFGLVIACNQIGIQITALLAGVSIIGLAIGFAAQETIANFIAGVVIFWDKPFKVGDWVDIDEKYGRVLRITFRSTRLLNLNGDVVILPNTFALANKLVNHSTYRITRVGVTVGIAYEASIDQARQTLLSLTAGDKRISKDPPPSVAVVECADSSVKVQLGFWISDESIEKAVHCEYLEKAKNALEAANLPMPYPHLQLVLKDTIVQSLVDAMPSLRKVA